MGDTPKVWSIYLITCTHTGLQYIGQTKGRVSTRWSAHVSHAARGMTFPIQVAIREFGEGAFTVATILCCTSKADADWAEKSLIDRYGTLAPNGYNLIAGAGMPGRKASAATRIKASTVKYELWRDPAYRERNIANSHKALEIARAALKEKLTDPAQRARITRARATNALKHRTIRDRRQRDMF